ncbi:hypothetical protein IAD21_03795 [Abditibacteriota bacterium]|nr:hypothetical protein IAD21_03795 [Abditibacteriota bacterium]
MMKPIHGIEVDQRIWPLIFHPDGSGVWGGTHSHGIDGEKREEIYFLSPFPHLRERVLFAPARTFNIDSHGNLLLACDSSGNSQLYDIKSKEVLWQIEGLRAGKLSPDGKLFVGFQRGKATICDVFQRIQSKEISFFGYTAVSGIWHPLNDILSIHFVGDSTSNLRFYTKGSGWQANEMWNIDGLTREASNITFSPCGNFLVFTDELLHLFSFSPVTHIASFNGEGERILDVEKKKYKKVEPFSLYNKYWSPIVFSYDSKTMFCGSPKGHILSFDFKSNNFIDKIHAHLGAILSMTLSIDGRFVVSSGEDRSINIWQTDY